MKRKIMSALLAIVLVVTMAVPALAATASAGMYGTLTGRSSIALPTYVRAYTSVTSNPDYALLSVRAKFVRDENGFSYTDYHSAVSDAGATCFVYDFNYADCVDGGFFTPQYAECRHTVNSGDSLESYHITSEVKVPQ